MPYRSALLNGGGMVHQVWRDVVVYDMWGNKLAVFSTSGSPATAWQSARRWIDNHLEAGSMQGEPFITTRDDIIRWITERKELFTELDGEQREAAEASLQGR
jgi:hypothetical protein